MLNVSETIPKRIIQTGKSRTLPLSARASAASLQALNPDFEYIFFDDEGVADLISREFSQYRPIFEGFPFRIQRFDFFRYLAVYHHGGFYFDLDVFLAADLRELLNSTCVFPFEELTLSRFLRATYGMDWEIGNYAFGAAARSPFLGAVIENCVRAQKDPAWVRPAMAGIPMLFRSEFEVLNTTGPGLLSRTLAENPKLAADVTVLFPEDVRDDRNWHQFGDYGVHMMEGSWRTRGGFFRRRLAWWLESRVRKRFLKESTRLGAKRQVLGTPLNQTVKET